MGISYFVQTLIAHPRCGYPAVLNQLFDFSPQFRVGRGHSRFSRSGSTEKKRWIWAEKNRGPLAHFLNLLKNLSYARFAFRDVPAIDRDLDTLAFPVHPRRPMDHDVATVIDLRRSLFFGKGDSEVRAKREEAKQ